MTRTTPLSDGDEEGPTTATIIVPSGGRSSTGDGDGCTGDHRHDCVGGGEGQRGRRRHRRRRRDVRNADGSSGASSTTEEPLGEEDSVMMSIIRPVPPRAPRPPPFSFSSSSLSSSPLLVLFVLSVAPIINIIGRVVAALPNNNCVAGGSGYGLSFDWQRADVIGLHWVDVPTTAITVELWFANMDLHQSAQHLLSYSVYNVDGRHGGGVGVGGAAAGGGGGGGDIPYESANELMFAIQPWQINVWWGGRQFMLDDKINPLAATYSSEWKHYAFSFDSELGELALYVDGDILDFGHASLELELELEEEEEVGVGGNVTTDDEGTTITTTKRTIRRTIEYEPSPHSNGWDVVNHDDAVPYLGRNSRTIVLVEDADACGAPTPDLLPNLVDSVALLAADDDDDHHGGGGDDRRCTDHERASRAAEAGAYAVIMRRRDAGGDDERLQQGGGGKAGGGNRVYAADAAEEGGAGNNSTYVGVGEVGGGGVEGNATTSSTSTPDTRPLRVPVLLIGGDDHDWLWRWVAAANKANEAPREGNNVTTARKNVTLVRTRQFHDPGSVGVELEPGGVLHMGQEADKNWGDFDEMQATTGIVDEFRVWNVVRTPDQIRDNYRRSIDTSDNGTEASNLVLYWNFDDEIDTDPSSMGRSPSFVAKDSSPGGGNDGLVGNLPTIDNQIQYMTGRRSTRPTAPRRIPSTKSPLVGDGDVVVPVIPGRDNVVELKSFDPDGDDLTTVILTLPPGGSLFPLSPDDEGDGGGPSGSAATTRSIGVGDVVIDVDRTENKRVIFRTASPTDWDFGTTATFRYSVRDDEGVEPVEATVRLVRHFVATPDPQTVTIDEDSLAYFPLARPSPISQVHMRVMVTQLPERGKLYQAQFDPSSEEIYTSIATTVDQYGPMDEFLEGNVTVENDRGIVMYRPNQDEHSTTNGEVYASFGYKLVDIASGEESDEVIQHVSVLAINDPPVAQPANVSVFSAKSGVDVVGLSIQLRGTDVDSDSEESFADRLYGRITSFPKAGRVYQFDATSNDARGEYMDSSVLAVPLTFAWAERVIRFSSQYSLCGSDCYSWKNPACTSNDVMSGGRYNGTCSDDAWHASQILGKPDIWPSYSGSKEGWELSSDNFGHEWIELEFPFDVFISGFELYETFKTGAVYKISTTDNYVDDPDVPCTGSVATPGMKKCSQRSKWKTLWTKPRELITPGNKDQASIFSPPLCPSVTKTRIVRVDLDTKAVPGWNTYDAAKLSGRLSAPPGVLHDPQNRLWYFPHEGVHGFDTLKFRMSDCLDEGPEAEVGISIEEPPGGGFSESVFASEDVVLDTTKPFTIVNHTLNATNVLNKIREMMAGQEELKVTPTVWHTTSLGSVAGRDLPPASLSSPLIVMELGSAIRGAGSKVELFLRDSSASASSGSRLTFRWMLNVRINVPCTNNGRVTDGGVCICASARWTGSDCAIEVSENTNSIPLSLKVIAYAMFGIIALASVISFWFIQRHGKSSQVVATAQPFFLRLVIFGCLLSSSTIVAMAQEGDSVACAITPWLYSLGFSIVFGSLFAKSLRVYKIYLWGAGYKRKKVTVVEFVSIIVALLAVDVVILTVWTITDPLRWVRSIDVTDVYGYVLSSIGRCQSRNAIPFLAVLAAFHVLILVLSSFLCYRSRHIPTRFSESKFIALAIVSNLEVFVLGIPVLIIAENSASTGFFVRSTIVFLNNVSVMGLIFGNLFMKVKNDKGACASGRSDTAADGTDDEVPDCWPSERPSERDSKVVRENKMWQQIVENNKAMKQELELLRKSFKKRSGEGNSVGSVDESYIYYENSLPSIEEGPESSDDESSQSSDDSDKPSRKSDVFDAPLDALTL